MFRIDGNFIGDPWFYIEDNTAHMWFLTMPASRSLSENQARRAGMRLQADQGSRAEVVAPVLHRGPDNEDMHSNRTRPQGVMAVNSPLLCQNFLDDASASPAEFFRAMKLSSAHNAIEPDSSTDSWGREERWKHWDIGYAVSSDLVNWEYKGLALNRGENDAWDSQKLATGSVIKRDKLYWMAYTGHRKNFLNIQYAGMAYSEDLEHWTKLPENPTTEPDDTIYDQGNRDNPPYASHWRDPYMVQDNGIVYSLICAQEKGSDPDTAGVVGLSTSTDMKEWKLLPPIETDRVARQMECPNIHCIDGTWYLVYSCSPGMIADSFKEQFPDHTFGSSIFSMTSESMLGPYTIHGKGLVQSEDAPVNIYAGQLVFFRNTWYIMGFQQGEDGFPAEAIADPIPVEARAEGITEKQV